MILRLRGLFASGEENGEEKGYFLHGIENAVCVDSVQTYAGYKLCATASTGGPAAQFLKRRCAVNAARGGPLPGRLAGPL